MIDSKDKLQAKDLMIGNWVIDKVLNNSYKQVEGWMFIQAFKDYAAIPLSPDILSKIEGVDVKKILSGTAYRFDVGDFDLSFNFLSAAKEWVEFKILGNGGYDDGGEMDITDTCKYLHQLQNLIFCLTGKELIINL